MLPRSARGSIRPLVEAQVLLEQVLVPQLLLPSQDNKDARHSQNDQNPKHAQPDPLPLLSEIPWTHTRCVEKHSDGDEIEMSPHVDAYYASWISVCQTKKLAQSERSIIEKQAKIMLPAWSVTPPLSQVGARSSSWSLPFGWYSGIHEWVQEHTILGVRPGPWCHAPGKPTT
jgi:hypothetical protein